MKAATLEYKLEVWEFLDGIKPGQMYTVAKLAKKENRQTFIDTIKEYMQALPWQGHITFNHDYSKFYKMTPI